MKICFKKLSVFSVAIFTFVIISLFSPTPWTKTSNAQDANTYFATTTNADCAEYYHFNGVKSDIRPTLLRAMAGGDVNFVGNVLNTNAYPIVSGKLYVKIFRDRALKDNNGPDVLDSFAVMDGVSIKAGGSIPVKFKWKVPAYALGGDYKLATYFITSDKFNQAGLSFTDDVVGGLSFFKVLGQQDKGVFMKKDGVKVNNIDYSFAAYPPVVNPTQPVSITVPVTNTTTGRIAVKVDFNVYKWDSQSTENLIDTSSKVAVVEPGKTIYMPMVITDNKSSVYYTEVVLNYMDSKSILGVRFVRDGVAMPRINFPSINSYPLISGQKNKIFACFHNASNINTPVDGKLRIEILTTNNNTIATYEYDGKIMGEMSAVMQDFTPSSTYKDFRIHASLFQGSDLVDEVYIPYTCKEIDPTKCGFSFDDISSSKWLKVLLEIVGLLVLIGLIILFTKRFDKVKELWSKVRIGRGKTFLFILFLVLFMSSGSKAHAILQYTLSVTNYNPSAGSISYTPVQTYYAPNSSVAITAYPYSGYSVTYFSGGGCPMNPINNTCYVYMTANTTVGVSMNLSSGSGSGSGSASNSSSGTSTPCFTVTNVAPNATSACNLWGSVLSAGGGNAGDPNACSVNNKVTLTVTGTNLKKVGYANMSTYPVTISNQTDTSLNLTFERLSGETTQGINLFDTRFFPKCKAKTSITFECKLPQITGFSADNPAAPPAPPNSGPTKGGDSVTMTGLNLNKLAKIRLGNNVSKITNIAADGTSVTFLTPGGPPHWVPLQVKGTCWASKNKNFDDKLDDAWLYTRDGKGGGGPPDPYIPPFVGYNTGSSGTIVDNPFLYYWATTTVATSSAVDLDGGVWANALSASTSATITYTSNAIYASTGASVFSGDTVNTGTKIQFIFDPYATSSNPTQTSNSIYWNGTGYTSDTPYGSWVDDADFPKYSNNICTGSPTNTGSAWNPAHNATETVDIFIPLSVNPPGKVISFTSTSTLITPTDAISPTNWGARPIISSDSESWSCDSPDSTSPTCTPIAAGLKTASMFYAPTFGYYYYGWRWTNSPSICYSNITPLHEKRTMVTNNIGSQTTTGGVGPCTFAFGTTCIRPFLNSSGSTVSCSTANPYYNREDNLCYDTIPHWMSALHTDTGVIGSNTSADYYSAFQLKFRESVYVLNFNVVASSSINTYTPTVPVITGPTTVGVNVPATYSALSSMIIAKAKPKSMFASVLFAIQQVFAQSVPDPQVQYQFDWNGDGTAETAPNAVSYGVSVSSSYTWSTVGTSTFAVRAIDVTSQNVSAWQTFTVNVSSSTDVTLAAPVIAGTYCGNRATLSWGQITNAGGYSLYKNSGWWNSVNSSSTLGISDTLYATPTDSYYMYAFKLAGVATATVYTYEPAVWTQGGSPTRGWTKIVSSADGTKLVALTYGVGYIYTSTSSGATWTARGLSLNWSSVASDATGTKLVAVVNGGNIYTSTDSGVTWTLRDSTRNWSSVASSFDGSKLVAAVTSGFIYTSGDSGATWAQRSVPMLGWKSVTSDTTGNKLAAVVNGGNIYTSTDNGFSWTSRNSSRSWFDITSSSDGTKLAAVAAYDNIYTSTDSGVTWTPRDSSRYWQYITSSADGKKLAATVSGGYVYTSNDSGVTWTPRDSMRGWNPIASSADGLKIFTAVLYGYTYSSVYSTTTSYVSTTTPPMSSAKSNVLSSLTKSCPVVPLVGNLGINSGLSFYTKPNWAGSDNKCTFWGSASSTMIDSNNVTHTNVGISSCYVDDSVAQVTLPLPSSAGSLGISKSLGRHTLYCNINYSDGSVDSDGNLITTTATTSISTRCNKLPNIIEK
jgi:IPT/TIG domain